jgi:transcriptional regulator MraZ
VGLGVSGVFLSTTINGVDAKGRVSVPAGFRAVVKNDPDEKIYVWPSFEGGYLEGGGQALLDRYLALLEEMDPYDDARAAFEQTIFGDTRGLGFDGTGRVTLPKDLIEHAGLTGKAAFVGLGARFEIWDPERLAERKANARNFARDNKKSLKLPPRPGGA